MGPLSRVVALAVAAGLCLLGFPAAGVAGEREAPTLGPLPAGTTLEHVHDAVLESDAGRIRTARSSGRAARAYATADGHRVEVEVSTSYPDDPSLDQKLVDFLATRVHGPELSGLNIYVGTPAEITRLCGGDPGVVACYAIHEARMYVPGESVRGIPVEYPLTHEYGHHIASWRSNNPWDALDWGAKHWASATRVCRYVRQGLLFPGDQGEHYFDDPGEGFADGYAHLHYPEMPWQYNELMRPGTAALAAIRRDVAAPWTGPRTRTFSGRLGPRHGKRTFRIRMALDGDVTVKLAARAGAVYEVEARTRGFAAGRKLRRGGSFGVEWCRRAPVEQVELTVRRRSGSGPFALRVSWPG